LIAQRLGCGDEEVSDLDQRGAARFEGAVARDPEYPDRFDDPGGLLRGRGCLAGEQQSCGHLSIDRVAFASPASGMRCVWLVDLAHLDCVLA
jgi:hypothetical protein